MNLLKKQLVKENYHKETLKITIDMAWPAIVESFFVAFAGLIDSLMVSSLGSYAVAAVGLTTQPKLLGLALFFALNVAISALVARRRGEKKQDSANEILLTAIFFIVIAAIISSIAFVFFASAIIGFCGSTADTHTDAVVYFRIIMGGMIFNCIQMGINAAQRGAGNTKITMRTNVTSNTINILLNYLLINGRFGFPALGIRGAALATISGTVVACIMSVASIFKKESFLSIPYILEQHIRPTLSAFLNLIKVAYSVFFEQVLMRIGFMLTAIMAADQGTAVALIGRSLGSGDPDLAKEYGRTCRLIGAVIAVCLVAIYYFGASGLYHLFFTEDHIVAIGVQIIHVIIFVVIFQICQVIYMGCLRGAGDTLYTAVASMISVTFIRTIISYFCGYVLGWGIIGIWMGVLGDQISRFIFATVRFRQGKWVKIKI